MLKNMLLIFILAWLTSCQSTILADNAGGTASEGESFVYGIVIDSSDITGSLRKFISAAGSTQITLAKYTLGESGYISNWSLQSTTNETGHFRISIPDSGIYTLVASNGTGARATLGNIEFLRDSLNLGTIGMHKPILLQGNVTPIPHCATGAQVSLAGGTTVKLDSLGAFAYEQASPGRNVFALQCDGFLAEWEVSLPGRCAEVTLQDLPWTSGKIMIDGNCQTNDASKADSGTGN